MDPWFDTHLQAGLLPRTELARQNRLGLRCALFRAHDALEGRQAADLRAHFETTARFEPGRARKLGVVPLLALGVGPARIPPRDLAGLLELLPALAKGARLAALGTLGLGEDTPAQREAFTLQLALAKRLKLPVLVRLPPLELRTRSAKVRATLTLLDAHGPRPSRVLLSGATDADLPLLSIRRHLVELGPVGPLDPLAAWRALGPQRLLLGSGLPLSGLDPVVLPRVMDRLAEARLRPATLQRIAWGNAARLFRVDEAVFASPHD